MRKIRRIRAWEILDSRGNPTIAAQCELTDGTLAKAHAPSGASTGKHEALELRDGDPKRYAGKGVLRAVANVNNQIGPMLIGASAEDQTAVDAVLASGKADLGANATISVSCAVARAAATSAKVPLWRWLAGKRTPKLPLPMINILSGGLHAGRNIEFQDFLVQPHGIAGYGRQMEAVVRVHRATHSILVERGYELTGVADEGGWGPRLESNEKAIAILTEAIERAGFVPGSEISIAIDVAASHFWSDGSYVLQTEERRLTSGAMTDLLAGWCARYPILSIEDGLEEDDWDGWQNLTAKLGNRVQLVGDDLFTTNLARVRHGISKSAANAVLVKMNQIGTLTETLAVVDEIHSAGWRGVVSARSGETEDDFLADLATATGVGQIKVGSITRSERLAKYNRLFEIEQELEA